MTRLANLTATSTLSLPSDSYIYKIVQVNGGHLLAAISSDDSLRLIDPPTLREIAGGIINNVHHDDGVTCLQAVDDEPNGLLTAGRDAVVRGYDLRSGQRTLQLSDDSNAPYLSLSSHGRNVAVGTELSNSEAAVLLWDTRSPSKPLQKYTESHNDDVTEVQFHPTRPRCLLSGSTDGLVNIYDVSISDEDDALLQVQNHGSSIHHAGFLSDVDFFALSHDEIFSLYRLNDELDDDPSTDDESSPATMYGDLRPRLDCDYIVDIIPFIISSSLGGGGDLEAIIGAGSHSTKHHLDLIPLRRTTTKTNNAWSLSDPSNHSIRLPGAHGSDIIRSMLVLVNDNDAEDGVVFTAGEDGLVKAWRTMTMTTTTVVEERDAKEEEEDEEEGEERAEGGGERPTRKRRKKKEKKKSAAGGGRSETGRFEPY